LGTSRYIFYDAIHISDLYRLIVNLIKYIVNPLPVLPGIASSVVIVLTRRFFSVQRFVHRIPSGFITGTLRFSLHPPVAAMLGCTDEPKKTDKPTL